MTSFTLLLHTLAILALLRPVRGQGGDGDMDLCGVSRCFGRSPSGDLWIGSNDGRLYSSSNSGRTWSEVIHLGKPDDWSADNNRGRLTAIEFFDQSRGVLVGHELGLHRSFLRTTDGGATWIALPLPAEFPGAGIQAFTDGHGWMSGPRGLLFSRDYGEHWTVARWASVEEDYSGGINFLSPSDGVLAAGSGEAGLLSTKDGGQNWERVGPPRCSYVDSGGPATEGLPYVESIDAVRLVGDRIVVHVRCLRSGAGQHEETFVGDRKENPTWEPLRVEGESVQAFAGFHDGLVAVTNNEKVVVFNAEMNVERAAAAVSKGEPRPVVFRTVLQRGEDIILFDNLAHVGHLNGDGFILEHLFLNESTDTAFIREMIQLKNGSCLGVSRHFLYGRKTTESMWKRLAELPRPNVSVIRTNGENALFVGSHTPMFLWKHSNTGIEEVPGSDGFHKLGLIQRGDIWLFYGMVTSESRSADMRARRTDTVMVGEDLTGIVYASGDGGDSWEVMDRWPGGRIEAVDIGKPEWITIYRAGGGIRRGPLRRDQSARVTADLQTYVSPGLPSNSTNERPYVEYGIKITFTDHLQGEISGSMYFGEDRCYETRDGGRTWTRVVPCSNVR